MSNVNSKVATTNLKRKMDVKLHENVCFPYIYEMLNAMYAKVEKGVSVRRQRLQMYNFLREFITDMQFMATTSDGYDYCQKRYKKMKANYGEIQMNRWFHVQQSKAMQKVIFKIQQKIEQWTLKASELEKNTLYFPTSEMITDIAWEGQKSQIMANIIDPFLKEQKIEKKKKTMTPTPPMKKQKLSVPNEATPKLEMVNQKQQELYIPNEVQNQEDLEKPDEVQNQKEQKEKNEEDKTEEDLENEQEEKYEEEFDDESDENE